MTYTNKLRVGAASLNQVPLDWEGNTRRIGEAILEARYDKGVEVLCLPELSITGYGLEDAVLAPYVRDRGAVILEEIVRAAPEDMFIAIGLPLTYRGTLFNCVAVLEGGQIHGVVPKQNLATDGVHYESRWYDAWDRGKSDWIQIGDQTVPFGDLVFEAQGVRIGFEICEDAWTGNRPGSFLAKQGVNLILNPSASHFSFGKHRIRRRLVEEGSRAFDAGYVYTNHIGNEAGRIIYDGGSMIAQNGSIICEEERFHYHHYNVTAADLDFQSIAASKTNKHHRGEKRSEFITLHGDFLEQKTTHTISPGGPTKWSKEEEFTEAVALGLVDYMEKSGTKGFTISLSGGADSSACAILAATALQRGWSSPRDSDYTSRQLTTVYQPSENSSEVSGDIASQLAEELDSYHVNIDVSEIIDSYKESVGRELVHEWDWEEDDITLQNIQARARAPSVWMFANKLNQLLLVTSNRSEAAVGYATMDGDTCGGLAPIAGVDKHFLMQWLRWVADGNLDGLPSMKAVQRVIDRKPTAELRPPSEDQSDEEDLMPYPVLDQIERQYVIHRKSPKEILRHLEDEFAVDRRQLRSYVKKFFRLWGRNQWKRERYAPAFHLDDENVDPRSFFRFPILNSSSEIYT